MKLAWRPRLSAQAGWHNVRWELWLGVACLLLTLAGLVRAAMALADIANDASQVPITELALFGERRFTSDADVAAAMLPFTEQSLFSADVSLVSDTLVALPWIDRAAVRREWPNRLRVFLQEQVPVAHWGEQGWLNQRGEAFLAPRRDELSQLPFLQGPAGSEQKVWQMWQQLSAILAHSQHQGQRLQLSSRHAWQLQLHGGIELALGRDDTLARLQRFIDVWPQLAQQPRQPQRIDLRYDTGLAVQWQEQHNDNQS
ncbi:cell division protein FtsQ/DivIB [Ferrimonas senticii]|uniref:cell division protein FtsQ/DivIB n=1 Tax=Ferrimonas senticii TaxID=394566 RepID=UPI0004048856|nr:cell division protein FtsQ/DivIB [Ferrimonas senticii]